MYLKQYGTDDDDRYHIAQHIENAIRDNNLMEVPDSLERCFICCKYPGTFQSMKMVSVSGRNYLFCWKCCHDKSINEINSKYNYYQKYAQISNSISTANRHRYTQLLKDIQTPLLKQHTASTSTLAKLIASNPVKNNPVATESIITPTTASPVITRSSGGYLMNPPLVRRSVLEKMNPPISL